MAVSNPASVFSRRSVLSLGDGAAIHVCFTSGNEESLTSKAS